jgi:hypothetical protein
LILAIKDLNNIHISHESFQNNLMFQSSESSLKPKLAMPNAMVKSLFLDFPSFSFSIFSIFSIFSKTWENQKPKLGSLARKKPGLKPGNRVLKLGTLGKNQVNSSSFCRGKAIA